MATETLTIALAQLNPTVGDLAGNADKVRRARATAATLGADLMLFPELFIAGYPPEDLVLKPAFQQACRRQVEALAAETADGGPAVLVGVPWVEEGKLYNAVAVLDEGRVVGLHFKVDLPNYGVFDEKRVFVPGPLPRPLEVRGVRIGVPICEDIWGPGPVACIARTGGEILLVPNGSPYRRTVPDQRRAVAAARVAEVKLPLVYLNQVGGQDELVFDGASFAIGVDGRFSAQLSVYEEELAITRWRKEAGDWLCVAGPQAPLPTADEADYAACVLGLRDYVDKNRFPGVVLGLSGGIDSALCATMAVDALGASRVHCVMLPYRFTSNQSLSDAADIAGRLGLRYDIVPIAEAVEGIEATLKGVFAGKARDVTEENLQSRARGTILMSISNKFGPMVVTTGNKSEMSTGYATLYGDMNGGFNPIKDLYKTEVWRLSRLRNRWKPAGALGPDGEVIPPEVISRPPTAELRDNQTDQDTLPPYEELDAILEKLVEKELPIAEIVAAGHKLETVRRVERMLTLAEYKRRQAAPGVKVTEKNFGRDRRYPITNRFRDGSA